jgi:hypothetical protein
VGAVQRGPTDAHLTFSDANQLRREMNICVAIFPAFLLVPGQILLSRIGTHGVECHYGLIHTILRGVSTWERCLDVETLASLIPVFRQSLVLHPHQLSRSRALPIGAEAQRGSFPGSWPPFRADDYSIREAARYFVDGVPSDLIHEYLCYHME